MRRNSAFAVLAVGLGLAAAAHADHRAGGMRGGGPAVRGGHGGRPGAAAAPRAPGIYSRPFHRPYFGYGSPHGYGNVVFPGTGHAPGTYSPFSIVDPTFGTRLTDTVSGFGRPFRFGHGGFGSPAVVVPYVVPAYVPPVVQPAPGPTTIIYIVPSEPDRSLVTTAPQPQPSGVVTYVVPAERPAAAAAPQNLYLIALKNHSIYSATEYWLEDDTLHYVTTYGVHNQVSLDQVDLDFTLRLNRERGVEFRLDRRP